MALKEVSEHLVAVSTPRHFLHRPLLHCLARKQLEREASNAKLLPNAQGLTPLFLGRAPPADGWGRRIK